MDIGRTYPTKVRPGIVGASGNALIWLSGLGTTKSFMRALLNPNPTRCLAAEQAFSYTWLTSIAAPTEYDLCSMRKNSVASDALS